MSKLNAIKLSGRDTIIDPLIELLRTGAEQLAYQAMEAKLQELLTVHTDRQAADGKVRLAHTTICRPQATDGARAEQTKLCALVGGDGCNEKHFLVIEDGIRESTRSWREVLVKLKSRARSPLNWPSVMICCT